MASGKQTPRQKMINMMYLVLTALLALNISKDILQALTKLNASLDETVQTVERKNADIYNALSRAAADNEAKAGQWNNMAQQVQAEANALYNDIAQIKDTLVILTGDRDENGIPEGLDNREKVANYLLNDKHASELKQKIESYRATMLKMAGDNPQLKQNIQEIFNTADRKVGEDGVQTSWESANFEHFPLAAVLPFLTDIQAKVRNTESDVISQLQRNIGMEDIKVSTVVPVVKPKSTYVTQGDEYEAEIMLAAYDQTQDPEIIINGQKLSDEQIKSGKGLFTMKADKVGEVKWGGKIILKQVGGEDREFNIPEQSFTVAPPTAVISPTKMNVLYRGVENPLEIGVPGVSPEQIVVNGPGVSKVGSGEYMANVTNVNGSKVNISVAVQEDDGSTRPIGSKEFRIKGLPPALGTMYKKNSGQLGASLIKSGTVDASYEDFPFDMNLTVTGFEVVIPGFPPERVSGNSMPSTVKTRIDRMKPGETIMIRDIRAKGPRGVRIPQVASISFDVN